MAGLFQERVGIPDDSLEREADRIATTVTQGGVVTGPGGEEAPAVGKIQRKCAACEEEEEDTIRRAPKEDVSATAPGSVAAEDIGRRPGPAVTPKAEADPESALPETIPGLLVNDASEPGRGQMRKSEFLSALRAAVRASADEALAGTGRDSRECPWIDHWFGYYERQDASHVERALRHYAPEARSGATAGDYIAITAARVSRSVAVWARTGQVSGVPEDVPGTPGPAGSAPEPSAGVFFKPRPGGARNADPVSVRDQLGGGQSLPAGLRSRMESVFGTTFARVRLHTDAKGAEVADQLNARAFTVGQHVAFGPGQFRPGTMVGDALIAHELAHVVQQGEAVVQRSSRGGEARSAGLEQDADTAAARAVLSIVTGVRGGLRALGRNALPRVKSGLRLQRCPSSAEKTAAKIPPVSKPKPNQTFQDWIASFPAWAGSENPRDVSSALPSELTESLKGADCADVALLLRHYYLRSQGKQFTFKAGPGKGEQFTLGSSSDIGRCTAELGSINFQEDRRGFRLVRFYKKGNDPIRNLKQLIDSGLKPGDVMVWKRLAGIAGNFEGHVQTVQQIDTVNGVVLVLQGNMENGKPKGQLQQKKLTFAELTGRADGDADIKDKLEESFFGAGPWMETAGP